MALPRGPSCSPASVSLAVLLLLLAGTVPSNAQTAGYPYLLPLVATEAAVAVAAVADTDKYILTGRTLGDYDDTVAGYLDLTPGAMTAGPTFTPDNRFCNGPLVWKDGLPYFFGGEIGNLVIGDGRNKMARWNPDTNSITSVSAVNMRYNRWYPSICRTNDNEILIVGGTLTGTGGIVPFAESFDLQNPSIPTKLVIQPPTFKAAAGANYYPFIRRLPKGDILWFGNRRGTITTSNFTVLRDLPPFPPEFTWNTMYPNTATMSMLAYSYTNGYQPTLIFFGGGAPLRNAVAPAANVSIRIDITYCTEHESGYCFSSWIMEVKPLGLRHVMGDSLVLPNGDALVYGGAQAGYASLMAGTANRESKPVVTPIMYNPGEAEGSRYTVLNNTNIARSYHSNICQHTTGEVLVLGCESCSKRLTDQVRGLSLSPNAPLEMRLEMVVPAAIAPGVVRPVINDAPREMPRGGTFTVSYTYPGELSYVSFITPCAVTHSMQMDASTIQLPITINGGGTLSFTIPTGTFGPLFVEGWYHLFLVAADKSYSTAKWVKVL